MNEFWFTTAGWFGHTVFSGGIVLAIGWILARRSVPASARSVAGWSVRGAVLAAVLCLLPGWITLPAPAWVSSPSATVPVSQPETTSKTLEFTIADEPMASDVAEVRGEWVLVEMPVEPAESATQTAILSKTIGSAVELSEPLPAIVTTSRPQAPPEPSTRDVIGDVARVVLVAYAFGLLIAGGQLMLGQLALSRIVAAASPAPGRVQDLFAQACDDAGVKARLLLSSRVASPVCFGVLKPTVVLPKTLAQTGYDDELKWVFAHELDHLKRGDHRLAWWVGMARAVYFFLPVFWAVRRQLGLAQEYLADAAAAKSGNPADYAQFLVSLSTAPVDRRAARHPLTATGVKAGRSDLFRRVNMLVNASTETTKRPTSRWSALAAGGTLGAAVLLSGFGFAADDKKASEEELIAQAKIVEKAKAADDEAQAQLKEAQARAAEARKRAEAAMKAAEKAQLEADKAARNAADKAKGEKKADEARPLTTKVKLADNKQIEALKKEIAEAAKKGDMEAVNQAAEKLAKLAAGSATRALTLQGRLAESQPMKVIPPAPPVVPGIPAPPAIARSFAPMGVQVTDATKAAHEQAMKHFKQAMERVKENPEAKAELEKAMKEFQKAMEKAGKDAPQAMKWLAQPAKDGAQNFQWQGRAVPGAQGVFMAGGGEGRLGVTIEAVPAVVLEQLDLPKDKGVIVLDVRGDSPAAKAGIKKNDIIIELAGKAVPSEPNSVVKMIGGLKKDEKVNVIVLRKGKKEEIKGLVVPEAKKVRVLEGGPNVEFFVEPLKIDEKELQEKIEKLREHVKDLKIEGNLLDHKDLEKHLKVELDRVREHMKDLKIEGKLFDSKDLELQLKAEMEKVHDQIAKLKAEGKALGGKIEGKTTTMSVQVNDGEYTIDAKKDGVKYEIKGSTDGGPSSIVIKDGDKTVKAESVEKLPEQYRADVKKMLGQIKVSK
jgi:beta-lactamase regulating signal transducer with metallopeptidase domain